MNFLAPLFLVGGAALALPVIFHLIRRSTRERTVFSSLMFLMPSPPRISKRHRVEHILLLILRCLALALLALGFSRPFFRQAPLDDPTAEQPKRIVMLVDISASMRREGLWAAARERVDAVLKRVGPADQLALYTFDRKATPLLSFEEWKRTPSGARAALASTRLSAVSPGWSGTHLGNALITAAETLAEVDKTAPGPRQVVLISDLQTGSRLDALQAYEWPKGIALLLEPVKSRNSTNAGLQLVADAEDSSHSGDAVIVRVRVSNSVDAKREQFKVGWAQSGSAPDFMGAPLDVYVPPGQSRVVTVPMPKGATAPDRILLRGDDEDFDNNVYVIPPTQQRARVLWLGSDAPEDTHQPLFFLRRAFSDTPRLAVQVTTRSPTAPLLPDDVTTASLLFVVDSLPPTSATALHEQVLAGKMLVFAPKAADSAATLGLLLGREGVALTEARAGNYAMLAEIDFQHPLFAPFADPRFSDFTKIHFWKYRKLEAAAIPDARVIAKFDSGDPALLEVPIGKGKIYILTAGWQPDDSQLAVSSKFVPMLWSLLELSGGVTTASTQYFVGDKVSVPADRGATTVRGPAGATTALVSGATDFDQTLQPGIYEFSGGARVQRFAVNLDANESRTAPLASDELEHLGVPLAEPKVEVPKNPADRMQLQAAEAENRQKLWRWFITATLAVLLVESALAGWTARRSVLRTEEVPS